jgi:hypothetical protein
MYILTDRQIYRQIYRQIDRQKNRQTERQTGQTDTERQKYRQTDRTPVYVCSVQKSGRNLQNLKLVSL